MLRLCNLLKIEIPVCFPISLISNLALISEIRKQASVRLKDHFVICLLKGNSRNTGKRCEISSKLTIKTPEQRLLYRNQSIDLFQLLTLNM